MSDWIYELIYETGGIDPGLVRIGDLELTSGNYVRLGGRVFSPGQEIDFEYGPLRLKRERGSTLLKAYSPGELHVFLFWTVPLWTVRRYRFTPVSKNPVGEVDVGSDPVLPLSIRFKDRCVTAVVAAIIASIVGTFIAQSWTAHP